MVRSTHRICNRRAHRFGCQKHAIYGSRWTAAISGLQRYIDCGQYGSTRLGKSWATGCDRGVGELPLLRYAENSKINALGHHSPREYWLKPPISKIRGFRNSL